MDPFDRAALELKKQSIPDPRPDPFEAAAKRFQERRFQQDRDRLHRSFEVSKEESPEAAGQALRIADEKKLPVGTVKRNRDKLTDPPNADRITRETPVIAQALSEPDNAAAMRDDIDNLSWFERVWQDTAQGFQRGKDVTRVGDIGWAAIQGKATPEQMQQARELAEKPTTDFELGFFSGIPGATAEALPLMATVMGRSADEAAVGAAIGTAAGSTAFGVGAIPGFFGGTGAGFIAGNAVEAARIEAGNAYIEYLGFTDEDGNTMDEDTARGAALITGVTNGTLEAYGFAKILESIPGVGRVFGQFSRGGMRKLLRQPTARKAIQRFGKTLAVVGTAEGLTEALQEVSTILGGEISKALDEGDYESITAEEAINRVTQALEQGVQGGIGLSLPGATTRAGIDAANVRKARQNKAFFEALGDKAKNSKTNQRVPLRQREIIQKLKERYEGLDYIYVDADRLNTFFQSREIDAETLRQDMPQTAEDLAEAQISGTDVAIPMEEFITNIAPTEGFNDLVSDLKLDPAELSSREADAIESAQEEYKKLLSEEPEAGDSIAGNIREQLQQAGTEETAADQQAQMWASFFRTMGERTGRDPQDLFESFNVEVTREQETQGIEGALNALRNDQIPEESNDPVAQQQRTRLQELQSTLEGRGINLSEMSNQQALRALSDALMAEQGREVAPGLTMRVQTDQGVHTAEVTNLEGETVGRFEAEESPNQGWIRMRRQDMDSRFRGQRIAVQGLAEMARRAQVRDMSLVSDTSVSPEAARVYRALERRGAQVKTNPHTINEDTGGLVSEDLATPVFEVTSIPDDLIEQASQERVLEQAVFHGTPHQFDRFSLEAIGSGEGAQAFGWGLYFAGRREIAEFYRDQLVGLPELSNWKFGSIRLVRNGQYQNYSPRDSSNQQQAKALLSEDMLIEENEIKRAFMEEGIEAARQIMLNIADERIQSAREEQPEIVPNLNVLRRRIESDLTLEVDQESLGNIVQAEIPDDSELLDWGRPLSEQPEGIVEKLRELLVSDAVEDRALADFDVESREELADLVLGEQITGENLYGTLTDIFRTDKEASLALNNAGIPGLRYLDAKSREQGEGTYDYVIWDENAVTIEAVNDELAQARELEQQGGVEPRGRIQFPSTANPDRWFKITLTGRANLSTFLHESGHFFLEAFRDMARQDSAPQEIKNDWEMIREYLGLEGEEIPTEAHEKWARGWEAYAMEGKAPSLALAEAFERFKTWLITIYRNFRQLDVELNDDIRDVMDRMLATRREIQEARQAQGYVPAFDSADTAGMTQAEYESYTSLHRQAMREAENDLDRRVMAEIKRRRTEEYRRRRDEIRTEVEAEAEAMPGYRAEAFLRRDIVPDDLDIPESLRKKLNKQALQDMYPDRNILRPMSFTYVAEGGVHPDVIAPYFGFESGREMVDAIVAQPRRKQFIDSEVKARLAREADDPMMDGTIAEEAIKAAHNDKRGRFLLAEVNALGKRVGAEKVSQIQVIQHAARRRVSELRHMDLRPHRYRQAEIRQARQAQRAVGQADYAAAHEAKRKQLLNHYLYREAIAAREEVEKAREYLRRFDEKKTRERIGKAGQDYLDQIDTLLANTEFRGTTLRRIRQRGTLAAWIAEQESEGNVVAIPDWLRNESETTNWRQMSIAEVRGLRDSVKNVESLARLKNKLQYAKEARDFEEAVETVVGQVEANVPKLLEQINQNPAWWEQRKETLKGFNASLTKVEFLARWMDGGEVGPVHELIFQPFVDAQEAEFEMLSTVGKDIMAPLRGMPREQRARLNQTVYVPQLDRRMLVKDLLAVALNLGNQGNKEKLLKGYGWTEQAVMSALDEHLTAQDWGVVQQLWDSIDKLWPDLAKIHRRHTGLEPPRVEAIPVETKHGTFRGGYFPVVYDRRRSHQAEINQQKGSLFENNYLRATVDRGFTEQRTRFYAPIKLSLDVIPAHVADVIHYVTHFEAVQSVEKLTSNARVRKAITESFGKEQYQILRPWLQFIANNGKPTEFMKGLDDAFRHLRTGMTVYAMGLKMTTGIAQLFGLATTLDEIGPKYTARGIRKFVTSPAQAWQFANENSGEIRFATRTFDRDVKAQLDKAMGQRNIPQDAINFSLKHIGYIQKSVNVMTWTGAYDKAIDQGKTHQEAIRIAESAVRTSQGSGAVKDLPKVMRGPETMRGLVMFYTYFSTLYNRFQDLARTTKGVKDVPRLAARWSYLAVFPILLDAFALGRGPDESDDESWTEWFLLQNVLYPVTAVPFVRDVANGSLGKYGYDISPIASALEDITGAGRDSYEAIVKGDDLPPGFPKRLNASVGVLLRLPTGQVWNTSEWVKGLVEGDLNNPFREFFQGVDRED